MLQPSDEYERNDNNEPDRDATHSASASASASSADIVDETNPSVPIDAASKIGAATSVPVVSGSALISETARHSRSEQPPSKTPSSGSKRKDSKMTTSESTNQSVPMPTDMLSLHGPTTTELGIYDQSISAAGRQIRRMEERQQQIGSADNRRSIDSNTVADVLAQYQRSRQQALELPSIQQPPYDTMIATSHPIRRQEQSHNTMNQEYQHQLLLQQRLQQQQGRWHIEHQTTQSHVSPQTVAVAAAFSNGSLSLQQSAYLNSITLPNIQQPLWMNYNEQLATIRNASLSRNAFQQLPQQQFLRPPIQPMQPSINFDGLTEIQQLLLANQRIEHNPFPQIIDRSMTLEETLLGRGIGTIPNHRIGHSIQGVLGLGETLLGRGAIPADIIGRPIQGGLPWGQNVAFNNIGIPIGVPLFLPASLSRPEDTEKLSPHQVLLRKQVEAFQASPDDVSTHTRGRNKPIALNQVGIRCRHCAHVPAAKRQKGSTYYPATILGIYQAAQNMSSTHIQSGVCSEMPIELKEHFERLQHLKVASSGAGRPYWGDSAKQLGLVDTDEDGIQFIRSLRLGASSNSR